MKWYLLSIIVTLGGITLSCKHSANVMNRYIPSKVHTKNKVKFPVSYVVVSFIPVVNLLFLAFVIISLWVLNKSVKKSIKKL